MSNHRYQVGGSLSDRDTNYVARAADTRLTNALSQGDFCYVFNSRQMGKSSLLVRSKQALEQLGYATVAIDLTGIGSEQIEPAQWYRGIIYQLYLGLDISPRVNLKKWWQEQEDVALIQRLQNFLIEIVLPRLEERSLVIFIDEIDSIFQLPFSSDDFFAFIRFCYNQRATNPIYNRLAFALFGVATPSQLIRDRERTPFNIGKAIELTGFKLSESKVLIQGFNYSSEIKHKVLERIFDWTAGQPFLTQKLCQLVKQECLAIDSLEEVNDAVDSLVKNFIIHNWEQQDDPEHLRTISNRLLHDDANILSILGTYQEILWKQEIAKNNSIEHRELLLSGLVEVYEGVLKVKNKLYQEIFNLKWLEGQLLQYRPYTVRLNNWFASKDNSQLLQGKALENALSWAKEKRLSNLDYQFLGASQELAQQQIKEDLAIEQIARQQANIALEAATEAHQLLARLKLDAKQKLRSFKLSKNWLIAIASVVTGSLYLFRLTSALLPLELAAYDALVSLPTSQSVAPITVIAIEEADLQNLQQYPMSDRILATAISNLNRHQPIAIGLDIYRDLPVEPGNSELTQLLSNTPNIIGVEKLIGSKINPNPTLAAANQIGFNDSALDPDTVVRRAILSYQTEEVTKYSFALQLALRYLRTRDILPEYIAKDDSTIKLGKSIITPLKPNSGSYINAKTGGYQIAIDYQGVAEYFTTYSLQDLLTNKIPPEAIQDRLVLLGATAASLNDFLLTPHRRHQLMPGIYVHANIIDRLVSAATEGKGFIKTWYESQEVLWLLLWATVGTVIARWGNVIKLTLLLLAASLVILLVTYSGWLLSWWIPVIPGLLALLIAAAVTKAIANWQSKQRQLRYAIRMLAHARQTQPAASAIALEYLKIGESPTRASKIDEIYNRSMAD